MISTFVTSVSSSHNLIPKKVYVIADKPPRPIDPGSFSIQIPDLLPSGDVRSSISFLLELDNLY